MERATRIFIKYSPFLFLLRKRFHTCFLMTCGWLNDRTFTLSSPWSVHVCHTTLNKRAHLSCQQLMKFDSRADLNSSNNKPQYIHSNCKHLQLRLHRLSQGTLVLTGVNVMKNRCDSFPEIHPLHCREAKGGQTHSGCTKSPISVSNIPRDLS